MADERDGLGRFIVGHTESQEHKEKRIASLIATRYSGEDCLAQLKRNNPYLFNSWRAILYTQKGKKIGCSDEWRNFKTFFDDVFITIINEEEE